MRSVSQVLSALLLFGAATGCSVEDQVLDPDPTGDAGSSSGDGDQTGGDGDAPGGDGDEPAGDGDAPVGDGDGDAPVGEGDGDGGDGDSDTPPVAKDADCDLNGVFIARQVARNVALSLGQFANTWYYFEFEQRGEQVVVKDHFDCGVIVKGTTTVVLTRTATEVLTEHNSQVGRKGTFKKSDGQCQLQLERFWNIRGADEARFRPTGADATLESSVLAKKIPLPTKDAPDGAEDWDDDGELGLAWNAQGIGTRHSIQRDWNEWFTDNNYKITPSTSWSSDFSARVRFNSEEIIIKTTSPIINTTSTADNTALNRVTFRFLGRTKDDPRVKAITKSAIFDTCTAIQQALPIQDKL